MQLRWLLLPLLFAANIAGAGTASAPLNEPALDVPTPNCLGAWWLVQGDENRNASIEVWFRTIPEGVWKQGSSLRRVERGVQKNDRGGLDAPADGWLFAGSVVDLTPDTPYELKLHLTDSDGGDAERTLSARTSAEPIDPPDLVVRHIVPASAGPQTPVGKPVHSPDGTAANPFHGLAQAQRDAKPGDIFLLSAGTYEACRLTRSGEPGRPIIYRGSASGEVIVDGKHPPDQLTGTTLDASGLHDVRLENLTLTHSFTLLKLNESSRMVVRRCNFSGGTIAISAARNDTGNVREFYIADNVIDGGMPWPATAEQWASLPQSRGIWVTGSGHLITHNRIHHVKDGIALDLSPHCDSIDISDNRISETFNTAIALDNAERNIRCFDNRCDNTLNGISFDALYGGPAYAFRNVITNVTHEPFKLHGGTSGAVMLQNTIVWAGSEHFLSAVAPITNCWSRNNLFILPPIRRLTFAASLVNCDFDRDGFAGNDGLTLVYNGIDCDLRAASRVEWPAYQHAIPLDATKLFAQPLADVTSKSGDAPDVTLADSSGAQSAGEKLLGFEGQSVAPAPDLGALQHGFASPFWGPRPAAATEPNRD